MNIDSLRTVCVMGWGKSGRSLCDLLLALKKKVKVSELGARSQFSAPLINEFMEKGVRFEFSGHSPRFIKDSGLVILSPGVDLRSQPANGVLRQLTIPAVGEVEFCSWLTPADYIAITGTNGKTTTTWLTHQVLKQKRQRVFLGGNIGIPFSSFVLQTKTRDLIVLEISSFQLETIIEFRPRVAALLNIEPDHLDRYSEFDDYFRAKLNIFRNQKQDDWALLNEALPARARIEKLTAARVVSFGREFANENFSCAYRIGRIFGLSKADCRQVFSRFAGLPHRLQLVRKIKGITFVNDSKATNPASTLWALKNLKGPVILIAGGRDKGLDYSPVLSFRNKIKKVNIFGEAASKIERAFSAQADCSLFSGLNAALRRSFQEAQKGDTVLFSPMCSSFDMFSDYAERGNKFIALVKRL